MATEELEPGEVARLFGAHSVILIDVREPLEYAQERIPGALLFPLSTFDPEDLPYDPKKAIVFHCAAGARSAKALAASRAAGLHCEGHMKGGIKAWKAAGLPTVTTDPATGKVVQTD